MQRLTAAVVLVLAACASPGDLPQAPTDDPHGTPAGVVAELYDLVTFGPGTTPDWDEVRSLFVEEAVVVLRTGREEMSIFSLEGFVNDFVQFIEQAEIVKTGFTERILDMRVFSYGDIAHVLVKFDSHVPGSERAPNEGLDSFELIRRDGRWRIVSIINERTTADNPIPEDLVAH